MLGSSLILFEKASNSQCHVTFFFLSQDATVKAVTKKKYFKVFPTSTILLRTFFSLL